MEDLAYFKSHTKGRRHTMGCERCLSSEVSRFRVYTGELDIMVCASCADEARRIGLPVEVVNWSLHKRDCLR